MIISRTPFRISFFGGGTDYPEWYRQHGGAVLATTIDKYCYLTCRYLPPFFDYRYRVVWSKVENRHEVGEIEHPVVGTLIRHLGITRGVEVHHVGDLPARSGMGSSSAFTVGLLHALHALQGRMVGKEELMTEAIFTEQELLKETVGSQDQASAAHGGFNKITFAQNGQIQVSPVVLRPGRTDELDSHLMLFYTGIVRTASKVAASYVTDLGQKRRQLRILRDLVDESIDLLASDRPIEGFGELLDEAWSVKRSLGAGISTGEVDDVYQRAMAAGAIGGKITGAGGGGFLLLFVPPQNQQAVLDALPELVHVPFHFESSGSQIIFYDREQDFSSAEAARESRPIRAFRELTPDAPTQWAIPYPHAGKTPVIAGQTKD
ncbi:MAG: kinase [Planctomycetes bacterium]|jgi:D-glycero-alpha-D-manno-heptose-7-phosphate kinase|nr:kinase [Planctomycetota bacterium]